MLKERTVHLKDLSEQLKLAMDDISQRLSGLRDIVVGLSECKCPTTFVIVPDITEANRMRWRNKLASGVTPDTIMSDADTDVALAQADALSWVKDLTSVFQVPDSLQALVDRFRMRRYKLKLVCDRCTEPCEPGYLIEKSSDTLVELLPMLQVSFKVLQVLNVASSIARCFFPPLPVIPAEYMKVMKGVLDTVKKKSSVEHFSCVQDALDVMDDDAGSCGNRPKQVRASASKLVKFLKHYDRMNQWGGLTRVVLQEGGGTDDALSRGPVLWCCNTCMSVGVDAVASAGVGESGGVGDGGDVAQELNDAMFSLNSFSCGMFRRKVHPRG